MITLLTLVPVLLPMVGAVVYLLVGWRPATRWVSAVSAAGVLVAVGVLVTVGVVVAVGVEVAVGNGPLFVLA